MLLLLLLQARSRSIETQLAEATTALHEMKTKHSQLEARNQLLEKVARLNNNQTPPSDRTLLWQVSSSPDHSLLRFIFEFARHTSAALHIAQVPTSLFVFTSADHYGCCCHFPCFAFLCHTGELITDVRTQL